VKQNCLFFQVKIYKKIIQQIYKKYIFSIQNIDKTKKGIYLVYRIPAAPLFRMRTSAGFFLYGGFK
jgi:hypothetical protein